MSPTKLSMVEELEELGLTTHEAQAYLAAVKLGLSTAVQIAREADLQRTEIYHRMSRLASLGLVDETLDKPARILGKFEKGLVEAKERGIKYRIIC